MTAVASKPVVSARSVLALDKFDVATEDEVMKLLRSVSAKQCALDPVPTWRTVCGRSGSSDYIYG